MLQRRILHSRRTIRIRRRHGFLHPSPLHRLYRCTRRVSCVQLAPINRKPETRTRMPMALNTRPVMMQTIKQAQTIKQVQTIKQMRARVVLAAMRLGGGVLVSLIVKQCMHVSPVPWAAQVPLALLPSQTAHVWRAINPRSHHHLHYHLHHHPHQHPHHQQQEEEEDRSLC